MLLRSARKNLIQVYWSEEILEEMRRNLVMEYKRSEAQAARRVTAMKDAFPEARVTGYEQLKPAMTNHPKDRHVLAAAVHIGAQTIVTNNLRDFRAEHLPRNMQAQAPDTFLQNLLSQAPDAILEVLHLQAANLKNPPIPFEKMLEGMARTVPGFIQEIRSLLPPFPITKP